MPTNRTRGPEYLQVTPSSRNDAFLLLKSTTYSTHSLKNRTEWQIYLKAAGIENKREWPRIARSI
jgi:hypothetical protein